MLDLTDEVEEALEDVALLQDSKPFRRVSQFPHNKKINLA